MDELNADDRWDTDDLLAITGGNPFYVTEALAGAPDHRVPATISDAVISRLNQASPRCRRALEKLSVWSGELPYELAESILGDDVDALAEAETRGLVSADHDGVRFRHELARRATESTLPVFRRREIDQHIVAVLVASGEDVPRLLHHAIRCDDAARITQYAPRAGSYSARVGANRQALDYFAAALAHEELIPTDELASTCDDYAWVLHIAHRFGEAINYGRRAVELCAGLDEPVRQTAALRRLARVLYMAAEPAEALSCCEQALELTEGADPEARAPALAALGSHFALTGDPRGVGLLEQAQQLVGRGAPAETESLTLNYLATARAELSPDERVAMLRQSLTVGLRDQAFEATARAWTNLVELLYRYGRLADVDAEVGAGLAFAREHGYWSHAYNLEIHHALHVQRRGNHAAAIAELEAASTRAPDPGMLLAYSMAPHARLLARRGDPRAEEMLRTCWRLALQLQLMTGLAFAGAGLVEWAWLAGRPEVVREVLAGWQPHAERPTAEPVDAEIRRYAARAGVTDDRPVLGDDPWTVGLRGDWEAAADHWEAAGDPYERALELSDAPSVERMLEGLRLLDLLEATAPARLVRARLADLGVRTVPRGPVRTTRINPAGLTDRQLAVVRLAGQGLTNAEIAGELFLSVRTVDHHVSAALAKLGISGRRQIAAALGEGARGDGARGDGAD